MLQLNNASVHLLKHKKYFWFNKLNENLNQIWKGKKCKINCSLKENKRELEEVKSVQTCYISHMEPQRRASCFQNL